MRPPTITMTPTRKPAKVAPAVSRVANHPVQERLAGARGDLDDDLVRQHERAARHRAPVATRLAQHRGRLPGDRGLVHDRDALGHVPVTRDDLARRYHAPVADLQLSRRNHLGAAIREQSAGGRLLPAAPKRVRLGLTATLGHRLGEVGEQHGRHSQSVTSPTNRSGRAKNSIVVITLPISTTNMTGILTISRGSSFTKARSSAWRKIAGSSSAAAGRVRVLTGRGPGRPASPGGTPVAEAVTAAGPGR